MNAFSSYGYSQLVKWYDPIALPTPTPPAIPTPSPTPSPSVTPEPSPSNYPQLVLSIEGMIALAGGLVIVVLIIVSVFLFRRKK